MKIENKVKYRRTIPPPGKKSVNGRPSTLQKLNLEQVRKLVIRGWTDVDIADFFEIPIVTLDNLKRSHPEFLKSFMDWRDEYDNLIERRLAERAAGYSHPEEKVFLGPGGQVVTHNTIKHYPPETGACGMWLSNRKQNWRTTAARIAVGGDPELPPIQMKKINKIDLQDFSEDELELMLSIGLKIKAQTEPEESTEYEETE